MEDLKGPYFCSKTGQYFMFGGGVAVFSNNDSSKDKCYIS